MPEASFAFTYDAAGRLAAATRGEQGLAFTYRGDLPTREASTGVSVNGSSIAFKYDDNGRVTSAGEQTLIYDRNGLLSDVATASFAEQWSVNDRGEA